MKIIHFPLETNYVNSFLCFDENTKKTFLVDCGAFEDRIKRFVTKNNFELEFLLITHAHYDHVDGVNQFRESFQVPVYSSTKKYSHQIAGGDKISFGNTEISVLATPGHTSDSASFYLEKAVFVGDAIFSGAVGGTATRQQFEEETRHIWNKILSLPDDTVIYPGHGSSTLVGVERLFNPFFR